MQQPIGPERHARWLFYEACEVALGVEGPCALARASHRSKAWWSRLRSGSGGAFPDWSEVRDEVLPPDLPPEAVAVLRQRHRRAWLLIHDPELLEALAGA